MFLLLSKLYELETLEENNIIDSYMESIECLLNGKDIIIREIISNIVNGKI